MTGFAGWKPAPQGRSAITYLKIEMNCVICKQGETQPGRTTVTLDRGGFTRVVKNVPAQICENCGEEYLDEATTAVLLTSAEEAALVGIQMDIREYQAA